MSNTPDIKKFSIPEMTSNESGKTSSSGAMGCLCIIIGCLGFIYGTIDYSKMSGTNEILSQSMMLVMVGAALLGVRKVGGSFGKNEELKIAAKNAENKVADPEDASEADSVGKV